MALCNFGKTEHYEVYMTPAGTSIDMDTLVDTNDISIEVGGALEGCTKYTALEQGLSIVGATGAKINNDNEKSTLVTATFVYMGGDDTVTQELLSRHGSTCSILFVNKITGLVVQGIELEIDVYGNNTGGANQLITVVGTADGCKSDHKVQKTLAISTV